MRLYSIGKRRAYFSRVRWGFHVYWPRTVGPDRYALPGSGDTRYCGLHVGFFHVTLCRDL